MKEQIRRVIFGYRTKLGKRFDIILMIAISLSVIVVILDSDKEIDQKYGSILHIAEWIFTILFTIEYGLRIYSAPHRRKYIFSFMGIVDLLSIIPTYFLLLPSDVTIHVLSDIRIIRLVRIFRILKLTPYLKGSHTMQIALKSSRPKIVVFLLSIMIMVTVLGSLMYVIEGQGNGFENIPKSIYWAIVTLTTVGYGNVIPVTAIGQFISAFIMILGYAIIAVPTGIVSAEFARNKKEYSEENNIEKTIKSIENKLKEIENKIDKFN